MNGGSYGVNSWQQCRGKDLAMGVETVGLVCSGTLEHCIGVGGGAGGPRLLTIDGWGLQVNSLLMWNRQLINHRRGQSLGVQRGCKL